MPGEDQVAELRRALKMRELPASAIQIVEQLLGRARGAGELPKDITRVLIAKHLAAHSYDQQLKSPANALLLSSLAIEVVKLLRPGYELPSIEAAKRLEADVWRIHTGALLRVGQVAAALDAAEIGLRFYALVEKPVRSDLDRTKLEILRGEALYRVGRRDEGREAVEEAAVYLLVVLRKKKEYVTARISYAVLLMRDENWVGALDIFEEVIAYAEEQRDDENIALILGNVGYCAAKVGDYERAEKCATMAKDKLVAIGDLNNLPRVRGVLVEALCARGKYNDAIIEVYKTRDDYLKLGMPIVAALFTLDVVRLMFIAGRFSQIPSHCNEMIRTFTKAGLHREVLKALAYLTELARQQTLRVDHVSNVRQFVNELRADESLTFHPEDERPVA